MLPKAPKASASLTSKIPPTEIHFSPPPPPPTVTTDAVRGHSPCSFSTVILSLKPSAPNLLYAKEERDDAKCHLQPKPDAKKKGVGRQVIVLDCLEIR
jgi:hypothetical protein